MIIWGIFRFSLCNLSYELWKEWLWICNFCTNSNQDFLLIVNSDPDLGSFLLLHTYVYMYACSECRSDYRIKSLKGRLFVFFLHFMYSTQQFFICRPSKFHCVGRRRGLKSGFLQNLDWHLDALTARPDLIEAVKNNWKVLWQNYCSLSMMPEERPSSYDRHSAIEIIPFKGTV